MDNDAVVAAVGQFEQKALGRINAIEEKMKASIDEIVDEIAELQTRSLGGGGTGSRTSQPNPEERKELEVAVRELIRGNSAKANELFTAFMRKANLAGSDPDGGYVVAQTFGAMQRIPAEISPLSALARTIPLTSGTVYSEPTDRDLAGASWVGETEARPDTTTPKLADLRIEAFELYAQPKASQTLIDSARIDVIGWLTDKIREAFGVAEDIAFFSGNGVGKPRGLLSYPVATTGDATRPWGTLQYITSGVDGAFPTPTTSVGAGDPLVDVVMALKPAYRPGARWLMSRATAGVCRKLKDADGRWLWADSLAADQPDRLLGYPVSFSESMPAIATDSLSIAFGDIGRAYTIIRRDGVKLLSDPYTDKPNVKLYGTQRVGGGISNFEALKFLRFGDS